MTLWEKGSGYLEGSHEIRFGSRGDVPLGHLGSALSAVSPPSFFCNSSLLTGGVVQEAQKALTLCKLCPAVTKTSLKCQHLCSQHKSKTQPHSNQCRNFSQNHPSLEKATACDRLTVVTGKALYGIKCHDICLGVNLHACP